MQNNNSVEEGIAVLDLATTMSNLPYALELSPESELEFTLTRSGDQDARCTMTLHHPGTTDEHLAFKVRSCLCLLWYYGFYGVTTVYVL